MNKLECKKCGYEWLPRLETLPKLCPNCKNRKWSEDKKK
jgi:predicted Zn-ribbon and HTH transcriptional regulator